MPDDPLLLPLIDRRDRARDRFASPGDLRPGTLAANWRRMRQLVRWFPTMCRGETG